MEACVVEYPRIQEEITLPKHESALAALLRDHLLDLDLFIEDPKGKVELEREEGGRSETRISRLVFWTFGISDIAYNHCDLYMIYNFCGHTSLLFTAIATFKYL